MKIARILSLLCLGGAAVAQPVQIANQGKSDYVIVTPDNPAAVVKTAAAELASHLKEVTGNTFAVVAEAARPAGRAPSGGSPDHGNSRRSSSPAGSSSGW